MAVKCKTKDLHRLLDGNLSIAYGDICRYVMEMNSSIRGDKHEFCIVVINIRLVRSCPSIDITNA